MADIAQTFSTIHSEIDNFKKQFGELFEAQWKSKYVPGHVPGTGAPGGYREGDLQRGCKHRIESGSILFYNDVEYASYVEEGTPFMYGQHQLRETILESEQIAEDAKQKAGL